MGSLSEISTRWTEMEFLMHAEGPAALASYLAARYFDVLARKWREYLPHMDDLEAHELAADVLYEFLKNDYRTLKDLDRNKGHLRGLFFKIIKCKMSRLRRDRSLGLEEYPDREAGEWADMYLDFEEALGRLGKERPRLHQPFVLHYLEGRSIAEIARDLDLEANAVKQRLYAARRWLAEALG